MMHSLLASMIAIYTINSGSPTYIRKTSLKKDIDKALPCGPPEDFRFSGNSSPPEDRKGAPATHRQYSHKK